MAASYSADYWLNSGGYSLLNNRRPGISQLFVRMRTGRTGRAMKDQLMDLMNHAYTTSTIGSVTTTQVQHLDADQGVRGGSRPKETITTVTLAAPNTSNANTLKELTTMKTRAANVRDLSGNGGEVLA